jgi:plasmid maintenance system antidote protein VapI
MIGESKQTLRAVLNGHASQSAKVEVRFEKTFGIRADTLTRVQTAYGLTQAHAHEDN